MSDSDAATLNADQNSVGGVQNNEALREKWKRGKVKREEVDRDFPQEKKYSDTVLGLQNGLNETGSPKVKCPARVLKGHSGVDLGGHAKNSHPGSVSQPQKTGKLQQQKTAKQRMQHYACLKCKGKGFASYLSFQRHLLLHISLPDVKLTRLIKEEEKWEDSEVVPSGRLQVARKRITASSYARSPLKFRLMCTNVNDGKDSFKLVKSSAKESEKPEVSDAPQEPSEDLTDVIENKASIKTDENTVCEEQKGEVLDIGNPCENKEIPLGVSYKKKETVDGDENSETEKSEVKATVDPLCNVQLEEQPKPGSSENAIDNSSTPAKTTDSPTTLPKSKDSLTPSKVKNSPTTPSKVKDSSTTPAKVKDSPSTLPKVKNSPSIPLKEKDSPSSSPVAKDSLVAPSKTKNPPVDPSKAKDSPVTASKAKDSPLAPSKVKNSPIAPSKVNPPSASVPPLKPGKQGREERIMRQMKNVESEMEKMQSKSPSVLQNSHDPRQIASDKNGVSSPNVAGCESLPPEFIPIEKLNKDGPPPLISAPVSSVIQSGLASEENMSETHILCEACGETVIGDQTALEDHCLCRGHYKCPICSVACASTDSLAVHSKESHPNADLSAHLTERKKKSSLRSVRQKHAEISDKDVSRDSLSDLSNSPSIPSPSADIRTPPLPSPTGVRVHETFQSATQNKRNEALMSAARVHEQDARRNSPSANSAIPSEVAAVANNYSMRGNSQQNPHVRLPPGRLSDTMPPPLMRPPNSRNNDSQPRSSMANVPMQAPPALYKMPSSHGINNTQPTPALPTIPGTSYIRGIPASGYQPDLQAAAVGNPFVSSASNHLAASAAALNARYQTMHHGYPPGSQPQPGYAAFTQPIQAQQRYQMAPPPPYPNQLPPHLQQNPRAAVIPPNAYSIPSSQQAYNQSLLKAQLEQARMQLPQSSAMLQSMQNLQQEHYQQQQLQQQQLQQQQLQQQLFQQPHHQLMQQAQQEQIRAPAPPQQQIPQKRKSSTTNPSHLRYHHQTALQNQQQLQSQLQQSAGPPPVKQRRQQRDSIGIPSKQTDSDCEIIAVQQRGEGVPVIQSIQGANASSNGDNSIPGSENSASSASSSVPTSSESTIHLTDSITLSVRQPPGSTNVSVSKGHSANAVASILATRGITVTPASGVTPSRSGSSGQRSRPSPPLNHSQAAAPSSNQNAPMAINSAISISHSSRPPQQANEGFAVPAPVASQRTAQRQPPPTDRPPRPPTVDLTDENAHAQAANSIVTCRLCDKQFPSHESLQQHMHVIHQTRNYFRCSICNTKHPSQQALSNHIKRVHKFGGASGAPPELVIPLVDLKNAGAMTRLSNLGVNYVISLSQLGMSADNSTFCIPIMSLDSGGQARNNNISGLMSMGTSAVLPIGPVKSLPAAQQHSQQPQSQQPQTVPSINQGNANLPPGVPLRPASHQYAQPSSQGPPR